ncbi:hypothetical protein RJ639_001532 [Escallonia herrerae]|uniref:CCHC-type domain-containing protein n=1 Tax=Escallonia herrerae TaxID=1293975 RepID=A0AA89BF02_9ASTE|nr:hypothetical protein RJ639_001532 [Escallonia herrerae]
MIAKNFKKFIRFKRNGGTRQQNASNEEKLCYKCHKPGHMKMDCPMYKREKKERRDVWERVKRRQLSKKENKEKEKAIMQNILQLGVTSIQTISSMAREKRARANSSRSRAAPELEPIAVEFDQNRYRNREAADRFSAQLSSPLTPGTPLNLPRLIMLNMIRNASHPALAIPYGFLLTRILAAFDIPLLGEYIKVTGHIVLDCSILRRKGLLDDRDLFLPEPDMEDVIVDDGDEDDADGDDDGVDADDDAEGDAGDGFDRDPPPLIIPSTHEAGTSSGPSTSGYEAILARLDMMQQHMHAGFSWMDLAHSQLSQHLSRTEDHCGIQCPEEDIFHPPPPPSVWARSRCYWYATHFNTRNRKANLNCRGTI